MTKLPEDFIFGAATAAYQCEGAVLEDGKGKVAWDDYLKNQGRFLPEPASDFYHLYGEDFAWASRFGIQGIRLSIAWSRIFPQGTGTPNQKGIDHYHKVLAEAARQGLKVFVTLHHFDTPQALFDQGDFLNRDVGEAFVEYARFCFEEFKEVEYWTTFNEIYPLATNQYLLGIFPPGIYGDLEKTIQCMHNMMYAHARVVNLFKEGGYAGKIGVVHSLEPKYPASQSPADIHAAKLEDAFSIAMLLDATYLGEYSADTMASLDEIARANGFDLHFDKADFEEMRRAKDRNDYLGINHYQCHFVKAHEGETKISHNGTGDKGSSSYMVKGIGKHVFVEGVERTDWDWVIYPQGLTDLLARIARDYPHYKEIYITENGMGCKEELSDGTVLDDARMDYLKKYLSALAQSIEDGIQVKGYFLWSLQDMFSWSNGYNKRYGLFYVDYETQKRYPKASAYWYRQLIQTKTIV